MSKVIFATMFLSGSAVVLFATNSSFLTSGPGAISGFATKVEEEKVQKISMDELPAAARESIKLAAATYSIDSVVVERELGVTMYEAAWTVDGRLNEVVVTADGTVIENEKEVALADSPQAIQKVVSEKMAKATEIKVTRKEVVVFEVEGMVDGKPIEVLLSATGLPVEIEVQGDDDEDNNEAVQEGEDDDDDDQAGDNDDDDDDHEGADDHDDDDNNDDGK